MVLMLKVRPVVGGQRFSVTGSRGGRRGAGQRRRRGRTAEGLAGGGAGGRRGWRGAGRRGCGKSFASGDGTCLGWGVRIERWDPEDEATTRACYEVHRAATAADDPVEPPLNAGTFGMFLREGFEKTPGEVWVASDGESRVAGFYRMELPDLENLDRAFMGPVVHPAARRHGVGSELLRHEAGRAAANGRTFVSGTTVTGSVGDAFAQAIGAVLGLEEVRRVQYLAKIAPGTIASLRAGAAKAAAGYSVVSWTGDPPEEYLVPLAHVVNAFEDAPHAPGVQAEVVDADRLRERTGGPVRAGFMRSYNVAAVQDATGEMAAFTQVIVDPEVPEWAYQELTAVTRAHRGHRLGLLVKTAMLELLAVSEPRIERIQTGNAAANEHMIAVNEQLGYEVVEPGWRQYEIPVAQAGA
jgi:GNAT superfamily N-acetyltransferase